jgi:hypothetical protein
MNLCDDDLDDASHYRSERLHPECRSRWELDVLSELEVGSESNPLRGGVGAVQNEVLQEEERRSRGKGQEPEAKEGRTKVRN